MTTGHKFTTAVAVLAVGGGVTLLLAQERKAPEPPLTFPAEKVKLRIVDATFVKQLEGANAKFNESQPDKFRGLVVTVEITKPANTELKLAAQDFALHYTYGKDFDVARCHGLSGFSTDKDVDRPMSLWAAGVGRSTTGLATSKAETVFVDMFFQFMEPETSEIHLFVAQPAGAAFTTTGWTP